MNKFKLESLDTCFAGYEDLTRNERLDRIGRYALLRFPVLYEDKTSVRVAVLIAAAIAEGTDPQHLAAFCGFDPDWVKEVAARMTEAEFWYADGSVDYDFLGASSESEWIAYLIVTMFVAEGTVRCFRDPRNGDRLYQMTEAGMTKYAGLVHGEPSLLQKQTALTALEDLEAERADAEADAQPERNG